MIAKKIKNPNKASSKAERIKKLSDYICKPERENSLEKCIYSGARGFLSEIHNGRVAEMIALSQEAVKSPDTINHYVVSWQAGEQPTNEQIERCVDIYLEELGLKEHLTIYGLHADTDNIHLHIEVNRVDPESLKVIKPNKGFDIESLHKATARIEHEQDWKREDNGRYLILENGELARAHTDYKIPKKPPQPIADIENLTGEKSAIRIASENCTQIFKTASSWQGLHYELAEMGFRYERTGSGATIFIGDIGAKASTVYRPASLPSLQKKLGPYEPHHQQQSEVINANKYFKHTPQPYPGDFSKITGNSMHELSQCRLAHHQQGKIKSILSFDARTYRRGTERMRWINNRGSGYLKPEPLKKNMPGWETYIEMKSAHYAEKNKAVIKLQKRQELERKYLLDSQRIKRTEIMAGNWKGKGALMNAQRSVLAAEQAGAKITMSDHHKTERKQLQHTYKPHPSFEQWLRDQNRPDLAEKWRHRETEIEDHPQSIEGDKTEAPTLRDIRDYKADIQGGWVHYSLKFDAWDDVSFTDKGQRIDIHDWKSRDSLRAALQLSAQKWGSFTVTGNDEYKAMCAKLAAEHGFRISNLELQETIEQEKIRLNDLWRKAMKTTQLKEFELYHQALGADRYRVTSIKMHQDGSKKVFILDKNGGTSKGFEAQEMAVRIQEMLRLQNRDENLYYTPLSETEHHIVIDDMNKDTLNKLIQNGYKPAVIIESSPGNFQGIITIPKLYTPHDKDVSNRLAERINQQYGDKNFSGCIHRHRAPGFDNRKPKHIREDGSYPAVKLLKAKRRYCEKTIELAQEINTQYTEARELKKQSDKQFIPPKKISTKTNTTAEIAYLKHYQDIVKLQQTIDNYNRVDSMIAVRLRATGHSKSDIESAIKQCAPTIRSDEQKNSHRWDDYAKRTANYAFGVKADADIKKLSKYKQQWIKLEGRDIVVTKEDWSAEELRPTIFSQP